MAKNNATASEGALLILLLEGWNTHFLWKCGKFHMSYGLLKESAVATICLRDIRDNPPTEQDKPRTIALTPGPDLLSASDQYR